MEEEFRHLCVYMWVYLPGEDRNYPGFHLAAQPESCLVLIDWLKRLKKTERGITRTIPLKPLRCAVATPISGPLRCRYFSKWRLSIHLDRHESRSLSIHEIGRAHV